MDDYRHTCFHLAKAVTSFFHQNGLLILDCGILSYDIGTLMPLTITDEQLDLGLSILKEGCARHRLKFPKPDRLAYKAKYRRFLDVTGW
jgi:4-aminobutyrate aminotransferase-like enzyme